MTVRAGQRLNPNARLEKFRKQNKKFLTRKVRKYKQNSLWRGKTWTKSHQQKWLQRGNNSTGTNYQPKTLDKTKIQDKDLPWRDFEGAGSLLYKQDEAAQDKGRHGLYSIHKVQVNTIRAGKKRTTHGGKHSKEEQAGWHMREHGFKIKQEVTKQ